MCGIAGFTDNPTIANPSSLIKLMLSNLDRRGPDGQGYEIISNSASKWHLGHQRLAILDIAGGKQPIVNKRQTVAVTYNGEIYNFQMLRKELLSKGHKFRTLTDTEVLVHGYEQWGIEGLLSRVEGMFAFCIVDTANDRTYLAVDPMGQKPLFYSNSPDNGLAFASSLKAVLNVPWVSREPNLDALRTGIALRHIPAPFSAYLQINKLVPGTYALISGRKLSTHKYWSNYLNVDLKDFSFQDHLDSVHKNLLHNVQNCLVSDVPVVLLLSSGLDSSLIAGMIRELGRERDIPAITVAFREKSFDESADAALVARHLGFKHEVVVLDELKAEQALELVLNMQEEPFSDPSLMPTLFLSEAVRKYAKVALGGDGGDELFCGYPTFSAIKIYRLIRSMHAGFLPEKIAPLIPSSHERYSFSYKLDRFCRGLRLPRDSAYIAWLLTSDPEQLSQVLNTDSSKQMQNLCSLVGDIKEQDDIKLMSLQYLRLFLPGVLCKVDMASMHHGLEVRAPFLQPSMIKLALSLPSSVKIHKGQNKYILRELAQNLGLLRTSGLKKQGFNVPLSRWITGKLYNKIEKFTSIESLNKTNFFNTKIVSEIWQEHLSGKANHFDLLWSIICTQHFLLKK